MADLFGTTKQNISAHINNIFNEGELDKVSVVKNYLTTAADGKNYNVSYYNLDMIISLGYRIKSSVEYKKYVQEHLSPVEEEYLKTINSISNIAKRKAKGGSGKEQ
ncbi:MAG: virulence RhuM family protein [Clostridiales bacterium]|nr:virulence RhuM family protein [Clostridiales bacterium]